MSPGVYRRLEGKVMRSIPPIVRADPTAYPILSFKAARGGGLEAISRMRARGGRLGLS